ncbi:MAG: Flp pilus assembly complex ATPase component TadA, partial [Anaerolineae bacterium]|nr:Flp pilus assembly complex ATPase component TadA [Anaerolineae bacterium]
MTNTPPSNSDDWQAFRPDADKGREPEFVSGQLGRRLLSIQALLERIEKQFVDEHAPGGQESTALREANTPTQRLKLVLAVIDYVLAVESVQVSGEEKARLVGKAYSDLFGYGPLDALFLDDRITTIALDGPNKASARYGSGELVPLSPLFQDEGHMRKTLRRLLLDAGTDLQDNLPFIETGLVVEGRPVCVNLIMPPLTASYTVDIRVHPKNPVTLDDLAGSDFLTPQAAHLLRALAASEHGLVIVGDPESGKTTLFGALAQHLPQPEKTVSVERAGEMHLPAGVGRLAPQWPSVDDPTVVTFGQQIGAALAQTPVCILLDEVRADEPQSIAPLLIQPNAPRQLWSFRGPFDAKRLRNALTMLAR